MNAVAQLDNNDSTLELWNIHLPKSPRIQKDREQKNQNSDAQESDDDEMKSVSMGNQLNDSQIHRDADYATTFRQDEKSTLNIIFSYYSKQCKKTPIKTRLRSVCVEQ